MSYPQSSRPAQGGLPAVDAPLVAPESGYEIIDGQVIEVPPALEPHADRNSKLAALLEAHVGDDFNVAVDMLTRTSALNNFAPDASVYPVARDEETGGRQLEHLAFEIVSTETMGHAALKAAKLCERGVRRGARPCSTSQAHSPSALQYVSWARTKTWQRLLVFVSEMVTGHLLRTAACAAAGR